jgi:hypothetical protein
VLLASIVLLASTRGDPYVPWLERGDAEPGTPWVDLSEPLRVAFGGLVLLDQTLLGVDVAAVRAWAQDSANLVAATWLPSLTTPLGSDVYRLDQVEKFPPSRLVEHTGVVNYRMLHHSIIITIITA